ncbi:MAG TPA: efflux RND transporter periplasmic adaptor subunit, partial [Vicinamibacterales bacterium]|nr:efflux RND transporter periplasmic adaptor subunit [Vicinamibacterales bacterium]
MEWHAARASRRWAWTAVVAAGVFAAWTARAFHRTPTVHATTAAVTQGTIVRPIVATGSLQAVITVQVGAQVSGTIASLGADFNSIVHAGQVIATLDPALFDAALREAQARVGEADAALQQSRAAQNERLAAESDAHMKLTRAGELSKRELIPQSDFDAARVVMDEASSDVKSGEADIAQASAAVVQANAAVTQARVNRDHTIITSPIDGIVVARSVDVGQTVASSVQAPVLFTIAADLRKMQLEVDIDEADIGGVDAGEDASFAVESYPDEVFHGRVATIRLQPIVQSTAGAAAPAGAATSSAAAAASVVSYATMIEVANPDEKLRPGMTATVTLDGAKSRMRSAFPTPRCRSDHRWTCCWRRARPTSSFPPAAVPNRRSGRSGASRTAVSRRSKSTSTCRIASGRVSSAG